MEPLHKENAKDNISACVVDMLNIYKKHHNRSAEEDQRWIDKMAIDFKSAMSEMKAEEDIVASSFLSLEEQLFGHGNYAVSVAYEDLVLNGSQSEEELILFSHIAQLLDEPTDMRILLNTLDLASTKDLAYQKTLLQDGPYASFLQQGMIAQRADEPDFGTIPLIVCISRNIVKIHKESQYQSNRSVPQMDNIASSLINIFNHIRKEFQANNIDYFATPTMVNLIKVIALTGTEKAREFIKGFDFYGGENQNFGNEINELLNNPKNSDLEYSQRERVIFVHDGRFRFDIDQRKWLQD